MIKVQDFAHSKGVTDKAIYKHINRHREELGDHIQKQGKNGTWLDDYACEFISGLMISNPIVVGDSQQQREINELKDKIEILQNKLIESQNKTVQIFEQLSVMKDENFKLKLDNKELRLKLEYKEEKKSFWRRIINR